MKISEAKKRLANLGITLKKNEFGEFEVNFKGKSDKGIYFASDLEDAVGTGEAMAKRRAERFTAEQERAARKAAKPAKKFRLMGRTTVFEVTHEFKAAGFIPSVVGQNRKLNQQTVARKADVIFLKA